MATFDITTNQPDVSATTGESKDVVFTVTNLLDRPVEGRAVVEWDKASGDATWATLEGSDIVSFAARESRRMTVALTLPADLGEEAVAADHRFRLTVTDLASGSGDHVSSPMTTLSLTKGPSGRAFPWLVAAIASVVIVVSGGILFAISGGDANNGPAEVPVSADSDSGDSPEIAVSNDGGVSSSGPKDACRSDRDCPEPRICRDQDAAGQGTCLVPSGERGCAQDDDCVDNNRCDKGVCVRNVVAFKGTCSDKSVCARGLACVENTCLIANNQDGCKADGDCSTGFCDDGVCTGVPKLTREKGVEYSGGNYRTISTTTLGKCAAQCEKDRKCKAYTFAPVGCKALRRKCFLKSSSNPTKKRCRCCTSGRKVPGAVPDDR